MHKLIVLLFCTSLCFEGEAQNNGRPKSPLFLIDVGLDKSIGPEKSKFKRGVTNPLWHVSYYSQKKYLHPSVRLRASALLYLDAKLLAGIQSGVTIHFSEMYGLQKYDIITVPIQLRICRSLVKLNSSILLDAAGGFNLQRVDLFPFKEKTGPLLSAGLLWKLRSKFFLRGGYEHQTDNGTYQIFADPSSGDKEETVSFKQRREQVYLAAGFSF